MIRRVAPVVELPPSSRGLRTGVVVGPGGGN
jgi:hypothetical protein